MADVILFDRDSGGDQGRFIQRFIARQPLPDGHGLSQFRQTVVRDALHWLAINFKAILDFRDEDVVPVLISSFPSLTDEEIIIIGSFMTQVDEQIARWKAEHGEPPSGPVAA